MVILGRIGSVAKRGGRTWQRRKGEGGRENSLCRCAVWFGGRCGCVVVSSGGGAPAAAARVGGVEFVGGLSAGARPGCV